MSKEHTASLALIAALCIIGPERFSSLFPEPKPQKEFTDIDQARLDAAAAKRPAKKSKRARA
jgi:hypothetical protein